MNNRVEEIIKQMTLKEKIGQLRQTNFCNEDTEKLSKQAAAGELGSCILAYTALAGNVDGQEKAHVKNLNKIQEAAVIKSRFGIPLLFGRDIIHGQKVISPIPLAQAASWNPKLVKACARNMAEEGRNDGINWTFAPMLDIARDPRWGRVIEGFGEDTYLTSVMAKASVEGIQYSKEDGYPAMAACAKHYIGYGAVEGGREYAKSEITEYTLQNVYLPPFEAAAGAGVLTVMSSFSAIGGEPVITSRHLLRDLLKKQLAFDGFVVSDYTSFEQLITQRLAENKKDCAYLAFNGGVDMEMVSECYYEYLEQLVEEGKIPMEELDDAVYRILKVKEALGLFESPYTREEQEDYKESHMQDALRMAEESAVLLKNQEGILPLKEGMSIAVCGPYLHEKRALHGSWAGFGDVPATETFAEAMEAVFKEQIVYCDPTIHLLKDGNAFCQKADVVVMALGERNEYTGERTCIAEVEFDEEQTALLKKAKQLGKKVVAVIFAGRPRCLTELEPYADAILYAWHPGSTGGRAAANILSGIVNPSGKLPMTMVKSTGQIPMYYNRTNNPNCVCDHYYEESMQPVYLDFSAMPLYEFGFGLSYSRFEIQNVSCEKEQLSLEEIKSGKKFRIHANVCNTSKIDGKEVVQLYIQDEIASNVRPVRELRGFEKIEVKAGETCRVTFELGYDELKFYSTARGVTVDPGAFKIYVGSSCYAKEVFSVKVV